MRWYVYRSIVYIPIDDNGYYRLPGGSKTMDKELADAVSERVFKLVKGKEYFKPELLEPLKPIKWDQ